MNNIMKLFTVSAISCAVIANSEATNAQATCVKPVQGFVSIGLFGSQSKIKGDVNLNKLKGYTNSAVLNEIGSKYLDDTEFNKIFKSAIKVEQGTQTSTGLKDGKIELYAKDEDTTNGTIWKKNLDKIAPSLKVETSSSDNNKVINITSTTDFLGNHSVVPVGTKYDSDLEAQVTSKKGDDFEGEKVAADTNNNPISVYDKDHPAPTITQKITVSADNSKNPGNLYQVALSSDDSNSSSSSWTAKGWQLSGFANVGLLVNLPLGGSWYLSFFGMKPFVNRNQNITLGTNNNSSSDDKNKGGFNAKNKGTLGIETGLRCNATDKVWLGIGGGVQRSWYGISLNSSSDNNNSDNEPQNMKGDAFFSKFSLGFNVTNNIGVETFVKYTAKHNLKTGTSKKKSDSADNSNSTEFPMDFSCPGAVSFGVACTFTF